MLGVLPFLAIALVLCTRPAFADDPPIKRPKAPAALEHLAKGTKLYNVRSFEDAAAEFKQGALVEPAPIFDYNLGQCYRQLGQYKDAIWHYERFLKASPETTVRNQHVREFITQMQGELDKKAMTAPPTEAAPVSASAEATPQDTTGPAAVVVADPPRNEVPAQRWYTDTLGWTFAGAGFVGVVVGGGFFLDASRLRDDANRSTSQQERSALQDKADSRTLSGAVIGVAGVGLLGAGIVKLALFKDASSSTATAWDFAVSRDGVFAVGRF